MSCPSSLWSASPLTAATAFTSAWLAPGWISAHVMESSRSGRWITASELCPAGSQEKTLQADLVWSTRVKNKHLFWSWYKCMSLIWSPRVRHVILLYKYDNCIIKFWIIYIYTYNQMIWEVFIAVSLSSSWSSSLVLIFWDWLKHWENCLSNYSKLYKSFNNATFYLVAKVHSCF